MGKDTGAMSKVSVIIPVYNSEAFLRQCIQSVIRQTYQNMEVLIIDDGSTDQSREVCEQFCRKDGRIRLYRQENKGVSSARNLGLEAAAGEYVFFLDSDDAIHPSLIEAAVCQAEVSKAELSFCSYVRLTTLQMEEIQSQKRESSSPLNWETAEKYLSEEWFHIRFERELSCIGGKMLRREYIGAQRFNERIRSGEDTLFLYELCCRQVRMAYADVQWYYYRMHSDSATHLHERKGMGQKWRVYEKIRDQEYEKGHSAWALKWEYGLMWDILSAYLVMKNAKSAENSRFVKRWAIREMKHPLYRGLTSGTRLLFLFLYAGCSYIPPVRALWVWKQRLFGTLSASISSS